jgi:thiamine biosynthesis protein ThiI
MQWKTMKVIAVRADKIFPKNSMEISRELGEVFVNAGYKAKMNKPEITIFVEFIQGKAYIYFGKEPGLGGLPVGSSGKVVSLLSGGIDSPVSTWYAMKRGCEVICVHIHSFRTNKEAERSKIGRILRVLSEYSPSISCFFVPYYIYQTRASNIPGKYDLAVFRRFLLKLAERIAKANGAKAIYTGESLGQVASQTLESIYAVSEAVRTPVLRPLIGFDKEEIICTAKYINTYNISIEEYRDCCSIIAKHPATRPSLDMVVDAEKKLPMGDIVRKSLDEMSSIRIP